MRQKCWGRLPRESACRPILGGSCGRSDSTGYQGISVTELGRFTTWSGGVLINSEMGFHEGSTSAA
jgi:hypothetical protein